MTAQSLIDPLADPTRAEDVARAHVAAGALAPDSGRRVGLELEFHLVDRRDPGRRPTWPEVQAVVAALPPMPCGSNVTVEPGGQLELSTPPGPDVVAGVDRLQRDRAVLGAALLGVGFAAAPLGADPARPLRRVNPGGRYVAMERHFDALGCASAGRTMMTATAALQVNLDAGPEAGWGERVGRLALIGPVLVALSAASPCLAGRSSGWASMREEAWHGIDPRRSGPVPTGGPGEPGDPGDPGAAWAEYALSAPVMLVRDAGRVVPVTRRIPFLDWLRGVAPIDRRPTLDDLEYHLTTLFPPVRPRGYLEVRYLDALPDRWWPALAAATAVLANDPVASDIAAEAALPVAGRWVKAARAGLGDPALRRAAERCLDAAARRCPAPLAAEVGALADAVAGGRGPLAELHERLAAVGPLGVLAETAEGTEGGRG